MIEIEWDLPDGAEGDAQKRSAPPRSRSNRWRAPAWPRGNMPSEDEDIEAVKAANQRFYDAFGALDIEAMEAVWEPSDRALCVHPGWQALVGWDDIRASWQGIFDNAMLMHFNVQYVNVVAEGNCGWVTCVENITSVLQGRASNFGILATNIFVRTPQGWRMTAHHGSP